MSKLIDAYIASLGDRPAIPYRCFARTFSKYLGSRTPTPEIATAFIAQRKRDGYAPGTLNHQWRIIRRMYRLAGLELTGEAPRVTPRDVQHLAVTDLMPDLITAARGLTPMHAALMAVSSVYGCRRTEMAWRRDPIVGWTGLGPKSFTQGEASTIYIQTAKQGRERYHLIAPEIASTLAAYDWPPRTPGQVSAAWTDIRHAAGLEGDRYYGVGWHAPRRSVARALERAKFSELQINAYLRWSTGGSMAALYAGAVEIGRDESRSVSSVYDEDLDREVFAALPWMGAWK